MATVYFAEDFRHQRRVALEVLHAEIAALLGTDRFLAEITTVATMQHPGWGRDANGVGCRSCHDYEIHGSGEPLLLLHGGLGSRFSARPSCAASW